MICPWKTLSPAGGIDGTLLARSSSSGLPTLVECSKNFARNYLDVMYLPLVYEIGGCYERS
jgi:hypothetical protein